MSTLNYQTYLEKIYAGWAGKSLGGILGAPIEGHKAFGTFKGIDSFPPKLYPNDDLDIQVIWLELIEKQGTNLSYIDLASFWKKHCWYNFAEYGVFLNNYDKGIMPPISGSFNNGYYHESMGCPIRAEIWGMICPAMPEEAVRYATLDGSLDHSGLSVIAEQYWAACVSLAFTETTLERLLEDGFSFIDDNTELFSVYKVVCSLVNRYSEGELSLYQVWMNLVRFYGNQDGSKMIINFAITLASLLIGRDDFVLTINTAINMGWDADCTAATAGALLGVLYGKSILPAEWTRRMGDKLTCDVDVRHKNASLEEFARNTSLVGIEKLIDTNQLSSLTEIPEIVYQEICSRKTSRSAPSPFQIQVEYMGEPFLFHQKAATLNIIATNRTDNEISVEYLLEPKSPVVLVNGTTSSGAIMLAPGKSTAIPVSVMSSSQEMHDKNIVEAKIHAAGIEEKFIFGFSGVRSYEIYGPYWDIYDKTKYDECPYRNDKENCHPAFKDCFYFLEHQYVDLNEKYLNEEQLFQRRLNDEYPVLFQTGADSFMLEDAIRFVGESCYYLARDVYSETDKEVNLTIGANCPFLLYVDGELAIRNNKTQAFAPRDFFFRLDISRKRRIVVKVLSNGEKIKFGMSFSVLDCVRDKTEGISYMSSGIIDCTALS